MLNNARFVIRFFVGMLSLWIWSPLAVVALSVSTDVLDRHGAERAISLVRPIIVQIYDGLHRQLLLRRDLSVHAHGSIADVVCQAALHELACDDVLEYDLARLW